jgi:DNA-binding transcriptional LysR family regulator
MQVFVRNTVNLGFTEAGNTLIDTARSSFQETLNTTEQVE